MCVGEAEKANFFFRLCIQKEFFQLKEIEKKGYQEKKIVLQSVKEVLQSLVEDGIVKTDKIGTTHYFWSFPSEARQSRQQRMAAMEKQLEALRVEAQVLQQQISRETTQREDSVGEWPLRASLLKHVAEKEKKHLEIVKDLERYHDSDPVVIEAKDNVLILQSYCVNELMVQKELLASQFDIPEDLDNIP
ncbi:hypothetical protein PORY_000367 [Pneumocystis oryctolagi]|uniref:Uncharacterized protein n=1 Tax=Pneumocystis oryctolagi TaxID=42067 RepID=A0ACB7CJG9_9ASCO|nr:hypothetical protein PORY_000367 [Pneumocystis oryctolagi]